MIFDFRIIATLLKKGDYDIVGQAYPIVAITGFFGYFLFYITDISLGLYENFYIRLFVAVLFLQLIFLKNNFTPQKICIVETILAVGLPLFYSYFFFATQQNIAWSAGFMFCGFTYGFLTGRLIHTITIFPLFTMLGFFFCDCLYVKLSMQQFFAGTTILLLSILTALLASLLKLILDSVLLVNIALEDRLNRERNADVEKGNTQHNKSLEKDLYTVIKLDTLSNLTGGLIKDFEDNINHISLKSMALKSKYLPDTIKTQRIDTVLKIMKKSRAMTSSIAAFSPNSYHSFCFTNINHILYETIAMISESRGDRIVIKTELAATEVTLNASVAMLEQAFFNIGINAIHAMPHGGTLYITTKNNNETHNTTCKQGSVVVCIKDTGVGMNHKTKENIFKPFFSTKGAGKGVGLGLAMVYEAIKLHHGSITVDSTPGKGTTFHITLPLTFL